MRAALLIASLLLLTACDAEASATPVTAAPSPVVVPSASVAPPNGTDLLFSEMMIAHHGQAVRMSDILLAKDGVPERVAAIADYIRTDQSREITEMNAWREAWGSPPVRPDAPHDGEGHGMLTEDQLAALAAADTTAATRLYLEQMIEHHNGAIFMAKSILQTGSNAYIRNLAKHIVNEQSSENTAMTNLL